MGAENDIIEKYSDIHWIDQIQDTQSLYDDSSASEEEKADEVSDDIKMRPLRKHFYKNCEWETAHLLVNRSKCWSR